MIQGLAPLAPWLLEYRLEPVFRGQKTGSSRYSNNQGEQTNCSPSPGSSCRNPVPSRPRCTVLFFYYLDPEFGLLHIRLPTWFPFTLQVYVNGHVWLAHAGNWLKMYDKRAPLNQSKLIASRAIGGKATSQD